MTSRKSTNVRIQLVRAIGSFAPSLAARVTARLFMTPPHHPRPEREAATARSGTPFTVRSGHRRIAARRYGAGPIVILLHGWGGRGSQLFAFVQPLVVAGFSVVTFDGPAHGASSGTMSSLPSFARALEAVIDAVGPIHGVIAHSMGAAAAMLAIHDGVPIPRAVVIAPPSNASDFFTRFLSRVGVSERVASEAQARLEHRARRALRELDVRALAPRNACAPPLLIVHDEDDRDVPLRFGEVVAAAWPNSELMRTKGLGHHRILRDPAVVADSVRFLVRGAGVCRCAQCELERELYDPSLRRPSAA